MNKPEERPSSGAGEAEAKLLRQRVKVLEDELKAVEFAYFLAFDLLPRHLREHVIEKIEERRNELRAAPKEKLETRSEKEG